MERTKEQHVVARRKISYFVYKVFELKFKCACMSAVEPG